MTGLGTAAGQSEKDSSGSQSLGLTPCAGAGEAFDKVLSRFREPLGFSAAHASVQQHGDLFRTYDAAADAAQSAFDLAERLAGREPQVNAACSFLDPSLGLVVNPIFNIRSQISPTHSRAVSKTVCDGVQERAAAQDPGPAGFLQQQAVKPSPQHLAVEPWTEQAQALQLPGGLARTCCKAHCSAHIALADVTYDLGDTRTLHLRLGTLHRELAVSTPKRYRCCRTAKRSRDFARVQRGATAAASR